jgi:hypothetical protein
MNTKREKVMFDEKKYTEDSIIKQLTLIQLHSTDGSALDGGCSCIEGKHLHALEGLAEEGTMTAETPQEKAYYEYLANFAREARKTIEEGKFGSHNPGSGECPKLIRCIKKAAMTCAMPHCNPYAVCRASVKCP